MKTTSVYVPQKQYNNEQPLNPNQPRTYSRNGNKTIYVKLKGEQINYDNKVAEGIKVTINTNITLDELSTSKASKIKMIYTNENGAQKEYSTDIDVNIVSREGKIS